jgi:hypothetical protein
MTPRLTTWASAASVLVACGGASGPNESSQLVWRTAGDATTVRVEYRDADAGLASVMLADAQAGRTNAAAFLGEMFPNGFTLRVYPDRASLTDYWRSAWNQSTLVPECWMIASATRSMAVALTPRVWQQSACGHDATNATYVQKILLHEIVHVLHGQLNPLPEVNAVGSLKWLTEGLAYYAAGQLDDARTAELRSLIAGGYTPTSLEAIPSGQGSYAAAASIIAYIDTTFGRDALKRLLRVTSTADALSSLGVSEAAFLAGWRQFAR